MSNAMIETLHDEAATAGDIMGAALCAIALGRSTQRYALDAGERAALRDVKAEDARVALAQSYSLLA